MTETQYDRAEEDLISRLQKMRERECGHVQVIQSGSSEEENPMDDPVERSISSERERAREEYRTYCNIVKLVKYSPRSYVGSKLSLGSIHMGKVCERGDDINASPPFVRCNLSDHIGDDGRFDLVAFVKLNQRTFPTIFQLVVCLSSIRTNEVGCERFFSTAGYVSCPRRTNLKVRNYECLATLKANIHNVFIDERWVVDQYLMMEKGKEWKELETDDDLRVLNLEQEMLAESLGVSPDTLPAIEATEVVIEIDAADDDLLIT